MGFLSKLSMKPSQKLAAAAPSGPKVASTGTQALPTSSTAAPVVESFSEPDDEPTVFTTFMVAYLGFFGVTLLVYPYMFSATWNPMAYWTSISDELAFAFRMAGTGFLTLTLGPFLDEMFGGPGVVMKAFARQMLIVNVCVVLIFMYYTFYAPLENAVPLIWSGQTTFQAFLVAWNVIEVTGAGLRDYYVLFNTFLYGFYALGLVAAPALFFGPGLSPFVYWNTWTELGLLCGRSLGIGLFCAVVAGYAFYAGYVSGGGFAKMFVVFNIINLGLFIGPAFYGGDSANESMWHIQVIMQVSLVFVGIYLDLAGYNGPLQLASPLPKCANDVTTFNFINLIWYLPFAVAFFTDPNMIFGPSTFTGFPLFLVDLDETSLWFGKAWATAMTMVVLGPYLFGLSHVKVAKQLTLAYIAFVGLFAYGLTSYSVFNFIMVAPLTGVNFLFFLWGLYLVLPGQSGEALL